MMLNAGIAESFNTLTFDPAKLHKRPGSESQSKAAVATLDLSFKHCLVCAYELRTYCSLSRY